MSTIAFSGHRPDKLTGYNMNINYYNKLKAILIDILQNEIVNGGVNKFITGGALGFDSISFDCVNFLKIIYGERIESILAIPFENQYIKWFPKDIENYKNMLNLCDTSILIDTLDGYKIKGLKPGKYHPDKMQKRNEWMVDNCDLLIACWNGYKDGGTWNCIKYARDTKKNILVINPIDFSIKFYNLAS